MDILVLQRSLFQLTKDLPRIEEEANKEYNLDIIKQSILFQTRMEKIIKRKKLDENTFLDFKMDDGEYACRIWEWWRSIMTKFPCFRLALKLVRWEEYKTIWPK